MICNKHNKEYIKSSSGALYCEECRKEVVPSNITPRGLSEGFVIRFRNGFRLKVKYEEYKRLHRIVCNVSERTVWDMLRAGESFDSMLNNVPDEFHDWLEKTIDDLKKRYRAVDDAVEDQLHVMKLQLRTEASRKEQALWIQKNVPRVWWGICYLKLDERHLHVKDSIWKLLRPKANKPYKEEL